LALCLAAHARKETNGRQYRPLAMLVSWVADKPDEKNICLCRYAHLLSVTSLCRFHLHPTITLWMAMRGPLQERTLMLLILENNLLVIV
jgi:hypothetical protein